MVHHRLILPRGDPRYEVKINKWPKDKDTYLQVTGKRTSISTGGRRQLYSSYLDYQSRPTTKASVIVPPFQNERKNKQLKERSKGSRGKAYRANDFSPYQNQKSVGPQKVIHSGRPKESRRPFIRAFTGGRSSLSTIQNRRKGWRKLKQQLHHHHTLTWCRSRGKPFRNLGGNDARRASRPAGIA